jgi:hypothetical protein
VTPPPYKLTNKRRCTTILLKYSVLEFLEDSDFKEMDASFDIFDFNNRLADLRLVISLEAAGQDYD